MYLYLLYIYKYAENFLIFCLCVRMNVAISGNIGAKDCLIWH